MRRTRQWAVLAASVTMIGGSIGLAQADPPPPQHGHLLVIGVHYDGGQPVGFDRCVELANGQALRLNAHHAHAHTGTAGDALRGAGHAVVPAAPLTPWSDCEELAGFLDGE